MGDTDYVYGTISNVSTNAFDITNAVNSGTTSGTTGAYIPAAKATSVSTTGATISSPSNGNIQINSLRCVTGVTTSSTYDVVMPQSLNNGAGTNNSLTSMNPPIVAVFKLSDGGYNAGGTVILNTGGNFNTYRVGGLNTFINNVIRFSF